MDLMPTLLELAGAGVPSNVEGRSLRPILAGEQPADAWRPFVHGEHTRANRHGDVQFLVSRTEKYTWFTGDGFELLFDLASDPQECVNLAAQPGSADRLAAWRARLAELLGQRPQDALSDGKRLIPGQRLSPVRPELLTPYYDNEGRPRPSVDVSPQTEAGKGGHRGGFWPRPA
jgi:arylsulfatase A-like enzyme